MLPTPSSISYAWNMGVLLMFCLGLQIVSGLFLSFHYKSSTALAFSSIVSLMNDVNSGWVIRMIHVNVASLFFMFVFIHVGRGLYYGSYTLKYPWYSGVLLVMLLMSTAFLGYVLPWGQMSYWGATVISSLLSAIPYLGVEMVYLIWGGFSVSDPTLTRIFSLHFLLPFLMSIVVFLHIFSLHLTGSGNPLGVADDSDKVSFHPFFFWKDLWTVVLVVMFLMMIVLQVPEVFMDPDNFIKANPLNTPPHIKPEWYFLFAYAILRSVPSKLGGVLALTSSIVILMFLPMAAGSSGLFNPVVKIMSAMQMTNMLVLTWVGSMPVNSPFVGLSQVASVMYFTLFLVWIVAPYGANS